jgi:hypothetical protein
VIIMSHTHEELSSEVAARLGDQVGNPQEFVSLVLDSFAQFTSPSIEGEVSTNVEYIKGPDPTAGGITFKPGNIRLNWRKLFEKAPELVLTGAGVTQVWLVPFAALYLWNLVWSLAKIEITPAQAMTMHALWNAGERAKPFAESEALKIVNAFCQTCGSAPLSASDFAKVVNDLVALDCIELTEGTIWLREWVKKTN